MTTAQAVAATWTMAPPEIGSYISDPTPRFTYTTPPTSTNAPDPNIGQDTNAITFDWNPAGTGTNDLTIVYRVQIATDFAFSHIVKQSPDLAFRSISQPNPEWIATGLGLAGNTTYYWRVTAHVLGETMVFPSPGTSVGQFTTVNLPPVLTTSVTSPKTTGTTTATPTTPTGTASPNSSTSRIFRGRHGRFSIPTGVPATLNRK